MAKMNAHEKFMRLSTIGIHLIELQADNPNRRLEIIRELEEKCERHISTADVIDTNVLETLRMLLCHEYKLSIASLGNVHLESRGTSYVDIRGIFLGRFTRDEELSLLYDIAVLSLTLRSNQPKILEAFRDFDMLRHDETRQISQNLCMKVWECYADACHLRSRLYGDINENFVDLRGFALDTVVSWLGQEINLEWRLLDTLLEKLIPVFGAEYIVTPVWRLVLGGSENLGKTLTTLCVMADICFPEDATNVRRMHCECCIDEEFWKILMRGLESGNYRKRMQSLYLANRALTFIESNEISTIEVLGTSTVRNIVPFVYVDATMEDGLVSPSKDIFFLVLESLEEKQKHLVLPTLNYLPELVESYSRLKTRGNGFVVEWLRCVFLRIFQHDSNDVKMFGLRACLKADLDIFDDDFMERVTLCLNDTLHYEFDETMTNEPAIVEQLVDFFEYCESSKIPLINTFFRSLLKHTWCPVAIYWILRALLHFAEPRELSYNIWTSVEMRYARLLGEKLARLHSKILRLNCQIVMLRMFRAYTRPINDSTCVELVMEALTCHTELVMLGEWDDDYELITEHLSILLSPEDAQTYAVGLIDRLDESSIEPCALAIGLLAESRLIFSTNRCLASQELGRLFDSLIGGDQRLYADTSTLFRIISLVCSLIDLSFYLGEKCKLLANNLVLTYGEYILKIVKKYFARIDDTTIKISTKAVRIFSNYLLPPREGENEARPWWIDRKCELTRLAVKCIDVISNPRENTRRECAYALRMLYTVCEELGFLKMSIDTSWITVVLVYLENEIVHSMNYDGGDIDTRKLKVECCDDVAKILNVFVKNIGPDDSFDKLFLLDKLSWFIASGSEDIISTIAQTLHDMHCNNENWTCHELVSVKTIVHDAWREISQFGRTTNYFASLDNLTRVIVDEKFLSIDDGTLELAIECIDELMREGETAPALKIIFSRHASTSMHIVHATHFKSAFVSCLLHGAVARRDQRIEQATISITPQVSCVERYTDGKVRAQAIVSLIALFNNYRGDSWPTRGIFLNEFIEILGNLHREQYHENSLLQRKIQRLMQTLLIIEPFLNKNESKILHDVIANALITENNQRSIRLLQEWLMVRIYARRSVDIGNLWNLARSAVVEGRQSSIVSVACIIYHLSRTINEFEIIPYVVCAIRYLLPNCMIQQFPVRLCCQMILVKLYDRLPETSQQALDHENIYLSVRDSLSRGNTERKWSMMLDDFYFSVFHPIDDYNLRTIFYEFPRLTGSNNDELIRPDIFQEVNALKYVDVMAITRTYENGDPWDRLEPTTRHNHRANGDNFEQHDFPHDDGPGDVQKKILPWKSRLPLIEELADMGMVSAKIDDEDKGLIVVASLIDCSPNLGGLARTCEIFGAKELVVKSFGDTEKADFQTLSVSAEKWITITEVKPQFLKNYLLEKQSEGWKLVAAEQTANSENLADFSFDEKTVLLLGNEKKGIPANLIPLMDKCVEIRQVGVVRSLNVHVTGAICIWHYANKHSQH